MRACASSANGAAVFYVLGGAEVILLKCALKKTSKKPSPTMIPYSIRSGEKQDYYSVNLTRSGHNFPDLLVRKSGKKGVACKEWVQSEDQTAGGKFSKNIIVPWEKLRNARMQTRHYLKGYGFKYDNASTFLWREFLLLPLFHVWKNQISQALYNTRTPVRSSRIELLKRLNDRRIKYHAENNNYQIRNEQGDSVLNLLSDIYGDRIDAHPKKDEYRANLLIDLDSLVATEDVKITNHKFVATGKAVATIAAYEEENRRHLDNKNHNSRILWLTVILAIVGVLQIPFVQNLLGLGTSP